MSCALHAQDQFNEYQNIRNHLFKMFMIFEHAFKEEKYFSSWFEVIRMDERYRCSTFSTNRFNDAAHLFKRETLA